MLFNAKSFYIFSLLKLLFCNHVLAMMQIDDDYVIIESGSSDSLEESALVELGDEELSMPKDDVDYGEPPLPEDMRKYIFSLSRDMGVVDWRTFTHVSRQNLVEARAWRMLQVTENVESSPLFLQIFKQIVFGYDVALFDDYVLHNLDPDDITLDWRWQAYTAAQFVSFIPLSAYTCYDVGYMFQFRMLLEDSAPSYVQSLLCIWLGVHPIRLDEFRDLDIFRARDLLQALFPRINHDYSPIFTSQQFLRLADEVKKHPECRLQQFRPQRKGILLIYVALMWRAIALISFLPDFTKEVKEKNLTFYLCTVFYSIFLNFGYMTISTFYRYVRLHLALKDDMPLTVKRSYHLSLLAYSLITVLSFSLMIFGYADLRTVLLQLDLGPMTLYAFTFILGPFLCQSMLGYLANLAILAVVPRQYVISMVLSYTLFQVLGVLSYTPILFFDLI